MILDRIAAFKFWSSGMDGQWAARLIAIQGDEVDWNYLEQRAEQEDLGDALRAVRRQAAILDKE